VRALKNGKSPGPDGVPPELFLHGGIALELALTGLFNFLWQNSVWPDEWRMAILIPLFKDAGSRLEPSNHRMLAMMSVIAKLFETVLNTRLRNLNAWVSDLQGGFREGRGTLAQMFILNEIVAMRWRESRRPVFLTFIDVRKAYDRVWRPGLWYKLREAGVSSRMLNMIREMYRKVARTVWIKDGSLKCLKSKLGPHKAPCFRHSCMLRISTVCMMHCGLRAWGVMVYGRLVPLLLYADDVVLLSKNADEARKMYAVVIEYARRWRFNVNHGKTKLVVFGPNALKQAVRSAIWEMCGRPFELADYYKYLGAEIGGTRGKWNRLLQRLLDTTKTNLNLLLWQGSGRRGLRARTFVHQWCTTCRPKAEYA
jgi:hypothetical protein